MTIKKVSELKIGDRVMGVDGKPHKITAIGNWTRSALFLSIDGKPDGAMSKNDEVEVLDGTPAPL